MLAVKQYTDRANNAVKWLVNLYPDSVFSEPLKYAIEGGKRVRPILLYLAHEALGGGGNPDPAAAAIELMHTASLIHDDLIDGDARRRGRKSFHVKYGETSAILIADYILSLALRVGSMYSDRRILYELSEAARRMSEGEMLEYRLLSSSDPIELGSYIKVIELKTASIFRAAGRIGALIAGGKNDAVDALGEYGRMIGLAYQLKDDLLDWFSEGEISTLLKLKNPEETIGRMAVELISTAKRKLDVLPESRAKNIMIYLADYAISRNE